MLIKIAKYTRLGFTLIELLIVLVISGILANFGIRGYMKTIRVERRQDAVLSLQKAMLIIQSATTSSNAICPNPAAGQSNVAYSNTTAANNCLSTGGFYYIHYSLAGYNIPTTFISSMLLNEKLILKADYVTNKSQANDDAACQTIYLSDRANIYPSSCIG